MTATAIKSAAGGSHLCRHCRDRGAAVCDALGCSLAAWPEYTTDQCRPCWRRLHQATGAAHTADSTRPPCRHLGAETGGTVRCETCPRRPAIKLFGCAVHGDCTPRTPVPGHCCCGTCPDYDPSEVGGPGVVAPAAATAAPLWRPLVGVRMITVGIGDLVLGLTACAGLKHDRPEACVVYGVPAHRVGWVRLFRGPDAVVPAEDLARHQTSQVFTPYDTYLTECRERGRRARWEYYAGACGTTARLPAGGVSLPPEAVEWAGPFAGATVLSPFADWGSRTWPLPHWLDLEDRLLARGHRVVVLDDRKVRCGAFRGTKVLGEKSCARVTAVLAGASCLAGNDSGMAHVAGMLGTRAVVVCGPARGEQVFGLYPSVKVLNGKLACTGCWWQKSVRGFTETCNTSCASLATVTPAEVVAALEGPWP